MSFDIEKMKELYEYRPDTGYFIQKVRTSQRVRVGDIAGSTSGNGYVYLFLEGKRYPAHRVAWAFVHGEIPDNQIDHINRNPSDNRIVNLRLVTQMQNNWNKGATKRSKSGAKGVFWDEFTGKWVARICINGRHINLGRYKSIAEADEAYRTFAKKEQGQFFYGVDTKCESL